MPETTEKIIKIIYYTLGFIFAIPLIAIAVAFLWPTLLVFGITIYLIDKHDLDLDATLLTLVTVGASFPWWTFLVIITENKPLW